jgi:hypothetical protein
VVTSSIIVVNWVFENLERRRPARRRHRIGGEKGMKMPKELAGPKRRVVTRSLCGKLGSVDGA